jgi:hypothetical protein
MTLRVRMQNPRYNYSTRTALLNMDLNALYIGFLVLRSTQEPKTLANFNLLYSVDP